MKELYNIFLKANQSILNLISDKDKLGMSSYKERKLFKDLQNILTEMNNNAYSKSQYLISNLFRNSKIEKIFRKLQLTPNEQRIVDRIIDSFMGNVINSSYVVFNTIKETYKNSLHSANKVLGIDKNEAFINNFLKDMSNNGITAFTDSRGRKWGLQTYSDMLIRTTSRMTTNYGVLYTYEHIDLYKISKHGTTCKICAPLEGRVYSRSGNHPYYPPLASAFGKIDKFGPNDLSNTYLNIHPNCLHVLIPFKEDAYSEKEIEEIRQFSSFETNPPNRDPRSEKQLNNYRNKENARTRLINDFKEYQSMKLLLGDQMPKTFQTFHNHKLSNSPKYDYWKNLYNSTKK